MTEPIIELVNLTKRYKNFTAVDNVNLIVNSKEIFGILGPNGAGKSTTILMILGLTEPTEGYARICGIDPTTNPIQIKRKVGYLPEDVGFYDDMTGFENLIYTAKLNQIPEFEAETLSLDLLEKVGLDDIIGKKVGKYSKGMRQRLGLADVLIKKPQIIILDEPTSGIDPQGVRSFLDLIVRLRDEEDFTILFSSHNLHYVQQVCDRVGIYIKGKLAGCGKIEDLSTGLFGDTSHSLEDVYNKYFEDDE